MAELASLSKLSDSEIDLSDMPEELDWTNAVVGKYYRPVKEQISIRLDADVVAWFKAHGKGYQSRVNEALRHYVLACNRATQKKASRAKSASNSVQPVAVSKSKPARAKGKTTKRRARNHV